MAHPSTYLYVAYGTYIFPSQHVSGLFRDPAFIVVFGDCSFITPALLLPAAGC